MPDVTYQDWVGRFAEYTKNLISCWDSPRADTPTGQALNYWQTDKAVQMLRDTLADYREWQRESASA